MPGKYIADNDVSIEDQLPGHWFLLVMDHSLPKNKQYAKNTSDWSDFLVEQTGPH